MLSCQERALCVCHFVRLFLAVSVVDAPLMPCMGVSIRAVHVYADPLSISLGLLHLLCLFLGGCSQHRMDRAKQLPPPTNAKDILSVLGDTTDPDPAPHHTIYQQGPGADKACGAMPS